MNADAKLYRFLELREALTSPRSFGRLCWAPANACSAPDCDSVTCEHGAGGYLRCTKCHRKWGEERVMLPASRARSHGLEGPLAELGDLVLLLGRPEILERRAWYVYVAGDYGSDGLPLRGESKGDYEGVAAYCRWRWREAPIKWNRHNVGELIRKARATVEREAIKRCA